MRVVLENAELKAAKTETGTRTLDFYAATFSSTPDKRGDMIAPDAFDEWLKGFYARGDSLPISFAHAAILNSIDASQIIGYAPADPEHVWVDQFGLRMKATLYNDNPVGQHVMRLIDDNVVKSASLALMVGDWEPVKGGFRMITKAGVKEAGPAMFPINDKAILLALKASLEEEPWLTAEDFKDLFGVELKAVDNSGWDGNRAMGMCNSASDYQSICAATHTIGQPGERQHYALPHHYLGKGPNAEGVRAALSRLPQTQNISDAERASAKSHLEAHMSQINPQKADELDDILVKSSPEYVQSTHDASVRAGAVCEHDLKSEVTEDPEPTTPEEPPAEPVADPPEPDKEDTPDVTPEDQPEELVKAEKVLEESSPLLTEEDRDIQRKLRYIEITQT